MAGEALAGDRARGTFVMTNQCICPPRQAAAGVRYFLSSLKPRPSAPAMFWSGGCRVTARATLRTDR